MIKNKVEILQSNESEDYYHLSIKTGKSTFGMTTFHKDDSLNDILDNMADFIFFLKGNMHGQEDKQDDRRTL